KQTQVWVSEYVQLDITDPQFGSIRADRFLENVVRQRWWSLIFYPVYFLIRFFNYLSGSTLAIFNVFAYLRLWMVLLSCRVLAIVYSFLREPIHSIRQIPINWKI